MTREGVRRIRLEIEYRELLEFCAKCNAVKAVKVLKTDNGVPVKYMLEISIRTYISETDMTNNSVIDVTIDKNYPWSLPFVFMHDPVVFHPNWYESGKWCGIPGDATESLSGLIFKVLRSTAFDEVMVNLYSVSNSKAYEWYIQNMDKPGMFPTQIIHKLSS